MCVVNKEFLLFFQTAYSESLVSEIFGGKLQSSVTRQHKKESVTVQPFFSLQLDIQVRVCTCTGMYVCMIYCTCFVVVTKTSQTNKFLFVSLVKPFSQYVAETKSVA